MDSNDLPSTLSPIIQLLGIRSATGSLLRLRTLILLRRCRLVRNWRWVAGACCARSLGWWRCVLVRCRWSRRRIAGRLSWSCRIRLRSRNRWGVQLSFVIALQPEVDRGHFQRHLVARIQRSIQLGVQLVHAVVPRIGLEPASQRKRRNLGQIVPVDLRSAMGQRSSSTASRPACSSESPSLGVFSAFKTVPRSASCAQKRPAVGSWSLYIEASRYSCALLAASCVVVIGVVHVDALEAKIRRGTASRSLNA